MRKIGIAWKAEMYVASEPHRNRNKHEILLSASGKSLPSHERLCTSPTILCDLNDYKVRIKIHIMNSYFQCTKYNEVSRKFTI